MLLTAVWPADLQLFARLDLAQPERHPNIAVRAVARSAPHPLRLRPPPRLQHDFCADGVPIAVYSLQPQCDPAVCIASVVAKELQGLVLPDHHDVEIAVVVDVPDRKTPCDPRKHQIAQRALIVGKRAAALVVQELLALLVA